jgi:hypothetical protein
MSEPTTFAKVEDGIVTDVRVVSYEFICANADRYGDASLWIECFRDGSGRGYASKGQIYDAKNDFFVPQSWSYDAELGKFVPPVFSEVAE